MPLALKNPYLKDVTCEYFGKNEAKVELQEKTRDEYLYIGFFARLKWKPIDIATSHGKRAIIKNVEPEIIYLPLTRNNNTGYREIGYPFKLTNTGIFYYRPENKTEKVRLYRKYPMRYWPLRYMSDMIGGKFEASNRLDFKHSELLYQIVDTPKTNYNAVSCTPKQKYRYVRFTAAKDRYAQLGELFLFRFTNKKEKIEPKAIKGSEPRFGHETMRRNNISDGDFLSFFWSNEKGGYVTLDLGKPENITQLVYVPRNDDNYITPGNTYELFYQNGIDGWVSLGQKIASERYLDFNNVPKNALLWLRNLSHGKEEQVFWMENGKQIF
jgi:hypothetical protein